jgi:site-specific DNA-methyltransferase (adenine-specific)
MKREVFGRCEMYLGDCMDYMAGLPDKTFDLAIVDPPYGIGADREYTAMIKNKKALWHNPRGYKNCVWDIRPPLKYFQELFRVSKQQVIWGGNYFELPATGGYIVWDKKVTMPTLSKCELAWTSFLNHCEKYECIWAGFIKSKDEHGNRFHPTQKPVALYKWLLSQYAKPGWRILDTHGGSFSSAAAAYEMGYEYVGVELDEDYYALAVERMKRVASQPFLVEPQAQNFCQREFIIDEE